MHRDAGVSEAQWRESARVRLGERFGRLVIDSDAAAGREVDLAQRANVAALRSWSATGTNVLLEDRIQALDTIVTGVWTLGEPGGRYARTVRRFERWMGEVADVEEARRHGIEGLAARGMDRSDVPLFVGELECDWRDDAEAMTRRIDGWARQLEMLMPDGEGWPAQLRGSSVARMVDGVAGLMGGMAAELAFMHEFEGEALAREEAWIGEVNRLAGEHVPISGAVWRHV